MKSIFFCFFILEYFKLKCYNFIKVTVTGKGELNVKKCK